MSVYPKFKDLEELNLGDFFGTTKHVVVVEPPPPPPPIPEKRIDSLVETLDELLSLSESREPGKEWELIIHYSICFASILIFELYMWKDILLFPSAALFLVDGRLVFVSLFASYVGWHTRIAANAGLDKPCMLLGVIMIICFLHKTQLIFCFGLFLLSLYCTLHHLTIPAHNLVCSFELYRIALAMQIFNLIFFLLCVVFPEPQIVLSLWVVVIYAMGVRAIPRLVAIPS